ncbi:hypothetical protein HYC85_029234 [Camellia sinensis]|uniref:Uncharacterized protein n=1 Tax=Camellia sinensis TaxID=4442 RepID=A0A7J7FXF0_CAMSI|nr:hypothetical protein HYC85_029234 [Camellia sinensis]
MIVLPLPTFVDLHEIGVQIEDAMKQDLIDYEKEQPRRALNRSTNTGTRSAGVARSSDVGMVTTTPPKTLAATPFTGMSGSSSQITRYEPRGQRTFTPLYMPLSKALGVLIKKRHLKPLESRPLPEKLPPTYNSTKYCAYHQQHGHEIDQCFQLRHEIQDLIDNRVITSPEKLNVTTNPLPPHNQAPPAKDKSDSIKAWKSSNVADTSCLPKIKTEHLHRCYQAQDREALFILFGLAASAPPLSESESLSSESSSASPPSSEPEPQSSSLPADISDYRCANSSSSLGLLVISDRCALDVQCINMVKCAVPICHRKYYEYKEIENTGMPTAYSIVSLCKTMLTSEATTPSNHSV